MELFLLRHAEFKRLYNCSGLNISQIPIEQRQFLPEAVATIILSAIYYILYLPCMFSIWKHMCDDRGNPNACYRILFYIGLMDLSILWIVGFLHGWLSLHGAVFCSHPTLIYLAGVAATSIWAAESTADLVLAINRCLDFLSPKLGAKLFDGLRVWFWLSLCSVYALYWAICEKPALFNGIYFAWFFNPFEGYLDDTEGKFLNHMEGFHDTFIAVSSPITYFLFAIALWIKIRSMNQLMSSNAESRAQWAIVTRVQKMTFLQVFIISLINTLTGSLYVIMQRISASQWLITLGQFAWLHIHGLPPVIYLCLNNTIRNDCRILWGKCLRWIRWGQRHGIGAMERHGATWTCPEPTQQNGQSC